jgi:murein peptide amidase A
MAAPVVGDHHEPLRPADTRTSRRCAVVVLVCGLFSLDGLASPVQAQPPATNSGSILIRPWNHDPTRPWEYVARRGQVDCGSTASGPLWNRPLFATSPSYAVSSPLASPPAARFTSTPRVEIIGHSVLGIPLALYRFGHSGPLTLIFGGIHGNERNSADLARRLAEHLSTHPDEYRDRRVLLLPVANPDGTVKDSRTNAHDVDLNRNFPATNWAAGKEGPQYGGTAPLSEPESAALAKLVEDSDPDRIISIHAIFGGRECNNYDGPAESLATRMGRHNRYPVKKSIGYPTPGSFGTWAGVERQIPVITLELPQGLPGEECWTAHREALLAVIQSP